MHYDLLIRNGTVIDGSGLPRFQADVAIAQGKIAAIGRIRDGATQVIDAEGHMVSPGFVDGHTHMDAQVFWDPLGTCSCWHGITSVVMGNCGFSLAPCAGKGQTAGHAQPGAGRGYRTPGHASRHPLELDELPGIPGRGRASAQGHQLRGLYRPLGPAHPRHGRARLQPGIQPGRPGGHETRGCAAPSGPGRLALRPHGPRIIRRRTTSRSPAAWPAGTRCVSWSALLGEQNAGVFEIANEDARFEPRPG